MGPFRFEPTPQAILAAHKGHIAKLVLKAVARSRDVELWTSATLTPSRYRLFVEAKIASTASSMDFRSFE